MGAKPVANTDVFCVGYPDAKQIPPGTIHPKRLLRSVVSGVRDYGNRMGIPTVNGAVCFDERYTGNPLVYCGTVGLIPKAMSFKAAQKGDVIVVVGGRTGRDGIHGATFSSVELHDKSETVSSGAVQIGNAIVEKMVLDTILQARDRGLYTAITDCGAGGLSSAIGEMGEELGAEVDLDKVPLKYDGLTYAEIWISEAQERMVLSVPPAKLAEILGVFKSEDVEATAIGTFTGTGRLVLRYQGTTVAELEMEFLHHGIPKFARKAIYAEPRLTEPIHAPKDDYGDALVRILSSLNVCSKEWIIRQYDHEVQGGSVVKPLTGVANDGPGDAAVVRPVLSSMKALAIGCGINPRYGDIDPYWMAANAIDEAIRNVVAVGADPERIAILDNFSWGDPNNPETLGALVRASQACHDIAVGYGTPFISGKDSLNNEYRVGDQRIRIPHTLLVSAMGIVPDATKAVTMDLKEPGSAVYILGETKAELGGSHFYLVNNQTGASVPKVFPARGKKIFAVLHALIQKGLVRACHDLSEGGLAAAAAEMAFAGGLGLKLDLELPGSAKHPHELLFSESASRFLIEVREKDVHVLDTLLVGIPNAPIGSVTNDGRLVIKDGKGKALVDEPVAKLKEAWQRPLRW
jgi:phosphoribosylformylglycinamidine synthase